jgi:hypothetical protein
MPSHYLEVQRNWRVDAEGVKLLSTERRKAWAVEVAEGVRRRRNLETGSIVEERMAPARNPMDLVRSHRLRVEASAGSVVLHAEPRDGKGRRHQFVAAGEGREHRYELLDAEGSLEAGSRVRSFFGEAGLERIEIEFRTVLGGLEVRGRQETTIEGT